ncbi:MAG: channel, inward rectifier [Acidobacteria bacterium]|nr:channel, inward rectifier [Acidobacteriota bacterium]
MSTVEELDRPSPPLNPPLKPVDTDLGFGSVVTRESRKRFLNRDGTFNVRREGLGFLSELSFYHYLLTISWTRFLVYVIAFYLGTNALFAFLYVACGAQALTGFVNEPTELRFVHAFFFSVHTLATIGYGNIAPLNLAANLIVTAESLVGLLGFGVVAGIMFARFARPTSQIAFSEKALIAPYQDRTAFMFRIVNKKSNELVDLRATLLLSRRKKNGGTNDREFLPLKLERDRVVLFPLTWTIVHPIDPDSPLRGMIPADFGQCDSEFLVLLNGYDETSAQTVHTRSSYKGDEVVWGGKFRSMFNPPKEDGTISVDVRKLSDFDRVELPVPA